MKKNARGMVMILWVIGVLVDVRVVRNIVSLVCACFWLQYNVCVFFLTSFED